MALKLSQMSFFIALTTANNLASASDFSPLGGITVNTGAAISKESTGQFAELSAFLGFFGASLEVKKLEEEEINGAFFALGFTYLLQAQVGATNHGTAYRFKSEFSPLSILFPRSSEPLSSPERITVSIGYERIPNESTLSNYNIGIGYVFN